MVNFKHIQKDKSHVLEPLKTYYSSNKMITPLNTSLESREHFQMIELLNSLVMLFKHSLND